jgi:hypothetical protein
MVLTKKTGLPTGAAELRPLILSELDDFSQYLRDRFGSGLSTPEARIVEAYIVWKILHEVPREEAPTQ